jgi:hypothetical protein
MLFNSARVSSPFEGQKRTRLAVVENTLPFHS